MFPNNRVKTQASLSQRLSLIGFRINYTEDAVNIEDKDFIVFDIERTLVDVAYEAVNDFRLLSILMSWIKVHGERVIAEKFFKFTKKAEQERGHNPIINGIAVWATLCGYQRWRRYISHHKKDEYLVNPELTQNAINYQGAKPDWLNFAVKVPLKMIRIRDGDVLTVSELCRLNLQYKNRYIYGASWRADVIFAIDLGFSKPAEIAKKLGCSYEPAHRIFTEYKIAKAA